MTGRRAGERGSASVWVLALSGLLALIAAATVLVGAAVLARHRATAAADLAALAAAGRAVLGDPAACSVGERVAQQNSAELIGCAVSAGAIVDVTVRVPVHLGRLGVFSATAAARAGPVAPGASAPLPMSGSCPMSEQLPTAVGDAMAA